MKTFAAFPLMICLWATAAMAEDVVAKIALPLKTPRPRESVLGGPKDKAEFLLWIPEVAKPVRGAICNPFSKMEPPSRHWQAACRTWRFAHVQADFDAVKKEEFGLLETALVELSEQTGHPEVASMPLCFIGMSRGGGMSMHLSELMPARTIAAAPVCLEVGPASQETRRIPVLTVFGEKDGSQLTKLLDKLPAQRAEDAHWAIAIQWGRSHEFGQANNLSFVFFDDIIGRRVSGNADAKRTPVLKPYPVEAGWLAGPVNWVRNQQERLAPAAAPYAEFKGDKSTAVWLPSARSVAVWKAFVSQSKQVKIVEPPGLGDGQPFTMHPVGRPILVKADVVGDTPTTVELWDADVQLGVAWSAPWEFETRLEPGIHSLILKAVGADVTRSSRPHTIVVGEPPPSNEVESSN